MATLINMQMDKEEVKEQTQPSEKDAPKYPWGLQIHLDDGQMEKLGIQMDAMKPGQKVTIIATAECTACSSYQTQGNEMEGSCDLQITDMQVSGFKADAASVLYEKK